MAALPGIFVCEDIHTLRAHDSRVYAESHTLRPPPGLMIMGDSGFEGFPEVVAVDTEIMLDEGTRAIRRMLVHTRVRVEHALGKLKGICRILHRNLDVSLALAHLIIRIYRHLRVWNRFVGVSRMYLCKS